MSVSFFSAITRAVWVSLLPNGDQNLLSLFEVVKASDYPALYSI